MFCTTSISILNDCGLFAIAFAIAIYEKIEPAKLKFIQQTMRNHYNFSLKYPSTIIQFDHEIENTIVANYTKQKVYISNFKQ